MEEVSTVRKLDLKKPDVYSLILLNKMISANDMQFLGIEFGFSGEMIEFFSSNYRTLGIVFKLSPLITESTKSWDPFLKQAFPPQGNFSRFANAFLSKDCTKLLLVTNKRLLKLDLERANEKLMDANFMIEHYNDRLSAAEEQQGAPRKGILQKVMQTLGYK
ncbi:hypothetical protein HYU13_04605 [Candidatus Woesearchaeota archaeon]|nr:hypothetical protein [Candidatus Woesearchaeota archaeon]